VAKPAGDTLKQIDDSLAWLVESMQNNYIKAGEFTSEMAHAKVVAAGLECTLEAMRLVSESFRPKFREII